MGPWPEWPPVFETVYAFMFLEPLEYSVMFKLEKLILNYMTASNAIIHIARLTIFNTNTSIYCFHPNKSIYFYLKHFLNFFVNTLAGWSFSKCIRYSLSVVIGL